MQVAGRLHAQAVKLLGQKMRAFGCRCSFNQQRLLSTQDMPASEMWRIYSVKKQKVLASPLHPAMDPDAVFSHNETDLGSIDVYGFDYDYTLATYSRELHYLIYRLGIEALVRDRQYPEDLLKMKYNPDFPIRGLHFDIKRGLFMKIDSFHVIQQDTVCRGLEAVSAEEVLQIYGDLHVPIESMNTYYGEGLHLHQLIDLFALPEVVLISHVIHYLRKHEIIYDPDNVFWDVRMAVKSIHTSGTLHKEIAQNLNTYLRRVEETALFLQRLDEAGKKLFLITNSGWKFVDAGMTYMVGPKWRDMFDVVICNARKPRFFKEIERPFRRLDPVGDRVSWEKVTEFLPGQVYIEGNFKQFRQFAGLEGAGGQVLYFGDHVYTDLADVNLRQGWRTGAVIPELHSEITTLNGEPFQRIICWLQVLQQLIAHFQNQHSPEAKAVVQEWLQERQSIRQEAKELFNPQFGSMFRTHQNPTYFSRRLGRFADIYTSSLSNLLNYPSNVTFYPARQPLQHEPHNVPLPLEY